MQYLQSAYKHCMLLTWIKLYTKILFHALSGNSKPQSTSTVCLPLLISTKEQKYMETKRQPFASSVQHLPPLSSVHKSNESLLLTGSSLTCLPQSTSTHTRRNTGKRALKERKFLQLPQKLYQLHNTSLPNFRHLSNQTTTVARGTNYASNLRELYSSMSQSHTSQHWIRLPQCEFIQLAMIGSVGLVDCGKHVKELPVNKRLSLLLWTLDKGGKCCTELANGCLLVSIYFCSLVEIKSGKQTVDVDCGLELPESA